MPLAVLSPAKTINEGLVSPPYPLSEPAAALADDRAELLDVVRALSKAQLKALMGVSDALADLNARRFADFDAQPAMNAAVAFDGPAHKALSFATLSADAQAYAQAHIVTLSGLYGLLRPRDAIRPYRLEMGTKLRSARGEALYAFWGGRLGAELCRWLDALPPAQRFIVNVASQEYWAAVDKHLQAGVVVYHIQFPGAAVFAKQARGLFCRFMAETRVFEPAQLAAFAEWSSASGMGFAFRLSASADGPDGRWLRFERVAAARGGAPSAGRAAPPAAHARARAPKVCAAGRAGGTSPTVAHAASGGKRKADAGVTDEPPARRRSARQA
ncbi:hypothetical protein KFE25_002808 [Diacronema lutheri]|uniref:Uncharacterized protein n=1 Tax=Diacronema lutheri TaxID=2081491 RepID=A0A8J6CBX0_DIALT|nr:hypothetical protein KFE25_002808 [Diacronema lutheri]